MENSGCTGVFRRKFGINLYKNRKLSLAEMSLTGSWLQQAEKGDLYPVLHRKDPEGLLAEKLMNGEYAVFNKGKQQAKLYRFLCGHFPYATYELRFEEMQGSGDFGFFFQRDSETVRVYVQASGTGRFLCCDTTDDNSREVLFQSENGIAVDRNTALVVSWRGDRADLYLRSANGLKCQGSITIPAYEDMVSYERFTQCRAGVFFAPFGGSGAIIRKVEAYLDCGIAQADLRPIRYEDGTPMLENGRVFLTFSARYEQNCYQGIFSWLPSTDEFQLEGALFFDYGDGAWCGDVASSILFDRKRQKWLVWNCAFSHGHILAYGESRGDPRFGVNVLDMTLMNGFVTDQDEAFLAKEGDEDPDLVWDEASHRWLLSICRLVQGENGNAYRYFLFEGEQSCGSFRFLNKTVSGENTGGSFVRGADGALYFAYGTDFDARARYMVHSVDQFLICAQLEADFDDGGFRGWGSVFPVPCGSRTKYVWITFDRCQGNPDYTWSYGNLYGFEMDLLSL